MGYLSLEVSQGRERVGVEQNGEEASGECCQSVGLCNEASASAPIDGRHVDIEVYEKAFVAIA